jgi:glycosyltransferase involved in cell wall biosynthesis
VKFSLVHPSRGRPKRAEAAAREWQRAMSGAHEHEHLLSVDDDDSALPEYRELAARLSLKLLVARNRSLVDAANRAARAATGDVLIVLSDDFGCPPEWDARLAETIGDRAEAAVFVHDGLDAKRMTLPILTRRLYERLGYVYHPDYFSMFADDDVTGAAAAMGRLLDARHLTFVHRHYSAGLAPSDATYERQNDRRAFWLGWRVYEKRRLTAFATRPATPRVRLAQWRVEAYYRVRMLGSRWRRLWLSHLPAPLRGIEARLRAALLRGVARAAAVDPPS